MAAVGEAGAAALLNTLLATAAVAGTTAQIVAASKGTPKPKLPQIPKDALAKAPDTAPLDAQAKARSAAALGRRGTLLTGPSGLGGVGTQTNVGRSTLLGG